jgi:hypothetical protein
MPETMKVRMMKLRAMRKDAGKGKMKKIPAGMHMMPDGKLMKNSAHRADSDRMRR